MVKERLQKIMAHAGYGSRRACEKIIAEGHVTVEGQVAKLGDQADPDTQSITVNGTPLRHIRATHTYIMLNKPREVISTVSDPQGRRTVLDLVPVEERIYPVGRLDYDSEGLILLTDDGDLTYRLTHPKYRHPRVYRVLVQGEPTPETLTRWRRGIILDGRKTKFDEVTVESQKRGSTWLRVILHEGRNHLVRRMVAALGHPARRLVRLRMGPLRLSGLAPGRWRHLTAGEVKLLTGRASSMSARRSPSRSPRGRSPLRRKDRRAGTGRSRRPAKRKSR